jgi:hypothetical protein
LIRINFLKLEIICFARGILTEGRARYGLPPFYDSLLKKYIISVQKATDLN